MASRKTDTTISEEQKKALMCVDHFQGSASKSFVYFSVCLRPENRLEKLQDICKLRPMKFADSPNRMEDSFNQVPEEMKPEHGYH